VIITVLDEQANEKPNTWDELDKIILEMKEKPRLEDFPRCQLGRELIGFDGEPYDGSVVNMGVKNEDGSVCYIIGARKDIRAKIGKQAGDVVRVTVRERK
jgi:hypothetical protein